MTNQQNECTPSEDSDQTGRISLAIRSVWSESSLCALWQGFFMRTAKTLIRLGGCPGWSGSSLGAHSFCWFVMSRLILFRTITYWFNQLVQRSPATICYFPLYYHVNTYVFLRPLKERISTYLHNHLSSQKLDSSEPFSFLNDTVIRPLLKSTTMNLFLEIPLFTVASWLLSTYGTLELSTFTYLVLTDRLVVFCLQSGKCLTLQCNMCRKPRRYFFEKKQYIIGLTPLFEDPNHCEMGKTILNIVSLASPDTSPPKYSLRYTAYRGNQDNANSNTITANIFKTLTFDL